MCIFEIHRNTKVKNTNEILFLQLDFYGCVCVCVFVDDKLINLQNSYST